MAKTKQSENQPEYVVVSPFRDKADFNKQYEPGEDVSHFDKERLDHLIKLGLVKKTSNDES